MKIPETTKSEWFLRLLFVFWWRDPQKGERYVNMAKENVDLLLMTCEKFIMDFLSIHLFIFQNPSIIPNLTSHLEVAEPGIYKLLHQEHDARQENGSSHKAAHAHHRGDHGVHGTIRHVHFRPQEEVQSPMNRDPQKNKQLSASGPISTPFRSAGKP